LAPVAVREYRQITNDDSDYVTPENNHGLANLCKAIGALEPRPENHIRIYLQDVIPPAARVTDERNNNASVFIAESVVDSRSLMLELTIGSK
jgi:hypothetical protein